MANMLRMSIVLAALLLAFGLPIAQGAVPPGLSAGPDGRVYHEGKPYRGVGANYYDLFGRLLHEPTNTSSLVGLKKLAQAGIPFVRFSASGFSASEWGLYLTNKAEYFRRMDKVVRAAERVKMGLIPSLFWTQIQPDLVGETRDQWGQPGSKTIAFMRRYVAEVVERYKDSPALWAWEFGNEVNLSVDLPNAAQFRKKGGTERDDLRAAHLVVMMTEFAREVRRHDPHRLIISGNSHPRASAWHNSAEKSWKADTREQTLEILRRDNPAPLDTIGIHIYGDHPVSKEMAAWATNHLDYLLAVKGLAREMKRPIFIGEFGVTEQPDPKATRAGFEQLFSAMEQAEVDLAAFWVYDFKHQDKKWNVTFENERSYVLQLTAEANKKMTNVK